MLGRLPWFALERRRRALRFLVFFDIGRRVYGRSGSIRPAAATPAFEVHIVTRSEVVDEPGLHVYRDLGPNDPALIELYHDCDVFCLPTMSDCLPMVLSEAGAAAIARGVDRRRRDSRDRP
jgi:glycosyltransferase involved in cell wall biosynthesis